MEDFRGTVRDQNNESKVGPLRKAFVEELFSHLELFKADIYDEMSIDRAGMPIRGLLLSLISHRKTKILSSSQLWRAL